jgi:hypothetical protein
VNACRFRLAARFHLSVDWSHKLSVGPAWRPLRADEKDAFVQDGAGSAEDVLLFSLPRHLQQKWTNLLEQAAAETGALTGFNAFAANVAELLAFKGLVLPADSVLEARAVAPGQPTVELVEAASGWRLWGAVNMGDEAAAVVFDTLAETATPAVRLLLEPGEGFRLPERALRVSGYTLERQEPDVWFLVRRPETKDELQGSVYGSRE